MEPEEAVDPVGAPRGADDMMRPEELLHDAVTARYVYPPDFPGFASEFHSHSQRGCAKGSVIFSPPDLLDFYPATSQNVSERVGAVESALAEAREIVADLWSGGKPARALGFSAVYGSDQNSVGVLIDVPDDPGRIQYRIRGRRVQQMTWIEDDCRVVTTILEVVHIDQESVLPHLKTISRTSLIDGRLISVASIIDTFQRVGGYPVPSQRRVLHTTPDGDTYDREIHFSNPVLLSVPDTWTDA